MTENEELKAAERRGYSKGYVAGKARKQRAISLEREKREKQAFLDRVFLQILPVAMECQGWTSDGKPVTSRVERVKLARSFAMEALSQRPMA